MLILYEPPLFFLAVSVLHVYKSKSLSVVFDISARFDIVPEQPCFGFFGFFNVILFSGSGLTNVALNKPATQSTYYSYHGRPENVVDGNKDTSIFQCTHTANIDTNPDRWWRVDLKGMFEIHTVVITNRGDCCG